MSVGCARFFILGLALVLAGCATKPPSQDQFLPTQKMPVTPQKPPSPDNGLVFSPRQHVSLFQDHRYWRSGDLVTINITQNATASTDENTQTTRTASMDAGVDSVFGIPLQIGSHDGTPFTPSFQTDSDNNFQGQGQTSRSNTIEGRVTAVVTQVMDNNVLAVQGQTNVNISSEIRTIQISGYARPQDIGPSNTVSSDDLANMTIQYVGQGPIQNAQDTPWLQDKFNKYSPF